ncbi:MAG: hypothetical protein KDA45_00480 [Planctomycetales bacterium]|nr:hypothetical protein [Planctomycetales bacterium]
MKGSEGYFALMPASIRRLGISKLATVSARQTPSGGYVAVKQFDRRSLTAAEHEQIFSTALRWQELRGAGLLPYMDVDPGEKSITMKLMDRSVATRLREGPSDPRLVLHTLRDVLSALATLHEQDLLHANLKPSNVFFDSDGRARLSDGLLLSATAPAEVFLAGCCKYLAPEQSGDSYGPVSPATDLYAAGFLALEMLAGERLWRVLELRGADIDDDDPAWARWHRSPQPAPAAAVFSPACPADLSDSLAKLLAKPPDQRFATARQALQALPQDLSVQTRGESSAERRQALASDVLQRPETGIVLAIASGPRAGEMIGTNETECLIGFDHDCFLRFSPAQYPPSSSKVLLRRGSEGWYVLRVAGDSTFVNQRQLGAKLMLRSGDIIRLTPAGPDVQFTLQSGGVAIRSLVDRFLPLSTQRAAEQVASTAASAGQSTGPSAAEATPQAAGRGTLAAAAVPPGDAVSGSNGSRPTATAVADASPKRAAGQPASRRPAAQWRAAQPSVSPGASRWRRTNRVWNRLRGQITSNGRSIPLGMVGFALIAALLILLAVLLLRRNDTTSSAPAAPLPGSATVVEADGSTQPGQE